MNKTLIVFFSRTEENYVNNEMKELTVGNTEVVASYIEEYTHSDILKLHTSTKYPYNYKECCDVAKYEKQNNVRPGIVNLPTLIDEYDNIYIGYPIWWNTYPMVINTFLEDYDFSGKNIYPFSTHEGSGLGESVEDLKNKLPNAIVHTGLAIRGSEVSLDETKTKVKEWIERK